MDKVAFLGDLTRLVEQHCETVVARFQPLTHEQLAWKPAANEWNILQCFDHLNLTHDYYTPKIRRAFDNPVVTQGNSLYRPSFWGRIYMYFALNPRYSFPTAPEIRPQSILTADVLQTYLAKQETLLAWLDEVAQIDLCATRIPIEKFVRFNLGDCLKVLVYHNGLHIGQAEGVLRGQPN